MSDKHDRSALFLIAGVGLLACLAVLILIGLMVPA